MDRTLAGSTWLIGGAYSLAGADYTPYLRRLEDLELWDLAKERYPNVARWFTQVQARPSYRTAILDWVRPEDRNVTNSMPRPPGRISPPPGMASGNDSATRGCYSTVTLLARLRG